MILPIEMHKIIVEGSRQSYFKCICVEACLTFGTSLPTHAIYGLRSNYTHPFHSWYFFLLHLRSIGDRERDWHILFKKMPGTTYSSCSSAACDSQVMNQPQVISLGSILCRIKQITHTNGCFPVSMAAWGGVQLRRQNTCL